VVGVRKLGGVVVDARIVGAVVHELSIGVGINLRGSAFEVAGREATTVEHEWGIPIDRDLAALTIATQLVQRLDAAR